MDLTITPWPRASASRSPRTTPSSDSAATSRTISSSTTTRRTGGARRTDRALRTAVARPLDDGAALRPEAFEGLKAYRGVDGGIRLFRYRMNLERLQRSARRLCMPAFDVDELADALRRLVLLEKDWIPRTEGCALYIRPNYIATDPALGVRPSLRYLLYIIVGPVGAYYPEGFNPVSIYVSDTYVRAVRGASARRRPRATTPPACWPRWTPGAKGTPGAVAGWHRAPVRGGGGDDEHVLRHRRRGDHQPADRQHPAGVTRDSVLHILRTWKQNVSSVSSTSTRSVRAAETGR